MGAGDPARIPRPARLVADLAVLVRVGQEAHGPRALHRRGEPRLLGAGEAGDAPRADLPALAHEPAERREVLPVELLRAQAGAPLALCGGALSGLGLGAG